MDTIKLCISVLALVLGLILLNSNSARAASFKFQANDSGSFLTDPSQVITSSSQGTMSGTLSGQSNHGGYSAQFLIASLPTKGPVPQAHFIPYPAGCSLPDGKRGLWRIFQGEIAIFHFDSTEDQLFAESPYGAGMECVGSSDPPTPFLGTLIFDVTGGTGAFSNASGSLTLDFNGQYLAFLNPSGSGNFGWIADEWTGTITTP